MTFSLRSKLAIAFALVATVPLVAIERVTARLVRREFGAWSAREFDATDRLVSSYFHREGERVAERVTAAARGYRLREAVLGFEARSTPSAQADLIREVSLVASEAGLPLLSLYDAEGRLLASAQEPERFDVVDRATLDAVRIRPGAPVLQTIEGVAVNGLALQAGVGVLEVQGGGWLVGGSLLDEALLRTLVVPDSIALLVLSREGTESGPSRASLEAARVLAEGHGGDGTAAGPGPGPGPSPSPGGAAAGADVQDVNRVLEAAGFSPAVVSIPGVRRAPGVTVLLASSRRPLEELLAKIEATFLLLLAGGLTLAWTLAWLLSERWTRPIDRLVEGFERVAQGDLAWRIEVKRDDEIGRLVAAFHAMTHDLAESRERLVQSERVAAWRDIARRLAHEIKNPLSPISLSMETLRRAHAGGRADFPELLTECTATVLEEVERLRRIVQEFSDFARLPKPRLVVESFHEVIRGVVSLHAGLGDAHRFALDLEEGEARFAFDPDQMNRLLVNLVKNAIEATPGGGEIRIRTSTEAPAASAVDGKGRFVLEVSDTGPGVAPEVVARMGEPYTTTKEGGTGLGLAIAARIAAEHGGVFKLANPGEAGARFRLELPR